MKPTQQKEIAEAKKQVLFLISQENEVHQVIQIVLYLR
jgi:hypothetical protein